MSTNTRALAGRPGRPMPFTAAGIRLMSLRKKTFFAIASTLVALIVILSIGLSWMLVGRFKHVEIQNAGTDVQITEQTLAAYFVPLRATARDWSAWDESYQFVQDGNAAYREANLTAFGLTNLQADLVAFVRPDGHITYATGVDRVNETLHPLPASLATLLTPNDLLVQGPSQDEKISGLLALPEGTLLVAAYPIVHSNGSGPSQGAFIIGRFLTPADLAAAQAVNHLKSLALEPRSAPDLPASMAAAARRLDASTAGALQPATNGSTPASLLIPKVQAVNSREPATAPLLIPDVQPVNSGLILASLIVPDVFGNRTFILQAGIDRPTFQQAYTAIRDLILALIIAGVVFLGLTLLLLDRVVLRRLARVSRAVRSIGSRRDLAMRLDPDGSDEIGQVAAAINQMLQDLEDAQVREHRLTEEITQLHIQIDGARRDREVARITESDYFRGLAERAEELRRRSSRAPNGTT